MTDPAETTPRVETDSPTGALGPVSDRDPATGRFLRGNVASMVTGERSRQFWTAADAERCARRLAYLRQRGFTSEADAPPALVAVCDGAAQAALVRDGLFNRLIESGGPTTTTSRPRRVFESWRDAAVLSLRHLQAIGLERVAAAVPSLDSYLAENYPQDVPENVPGHAQDSLHTTNATPDDCQAMSGSDRAVEADSVASGGSRDGEEDA